MMMSFRNKISSAILSIIFLFSGCTNLSTDPPSGGTSNTKLEIFSPKKDDVIGVGKTEINYSISTPYSLKFMELYVNGLFTGNFPPAAGSSQPIIQLNISESFIGSSISYYLIYYDVNGTSIKSEEILSVKVVETIDPPSAPFNLKILNLSISTINLSWEDSSLEVDTYEIWRKEDFSGIYQKHFDVNGNVFNINDENLDPEKIYLYKVKGFNQYGESSFSEEVNTFGVGSSGDLIPPTNLTTIARGTRLVKLSWKDNSTNENYFAVERKRVNEPYKKTGIVEKNITFYTDSSNNLVPGGEYLYRIKSYSNTDSAWSNESFVQTYWYDIIRPTNLQGIYLGENRIVLTWNDNDNTNTIFEIERKKEGEEQFKTIASIPGEQNTYLDENLIPLQFYTYRVRSGDGVYYSDYSNEITVFTGS